MFNDHDHLGHRVRRTGLVISFAFHDFDAFRETELSALVSSDDNIPAGLVVISGKLLDAVRNGNRAWSLHFRQACGALHVNLAIASFH